MESALFRMPPMCALLRAAPRQTRRLIRPVNKRNIANKFDSAYFTSLARKKRPVRRDPLKKVPLDKKQPVDIILPVTIESFRVVGGQIILLP
ncbi:hypothetical protein ACR6A7_04975 [Pantoea sp. RRHST58]|uniref:hypothetical protein n=1 Tax=Pantoea sp. RRHST58 TaxID=3425183 RepID=UPI003DA172CB